ncbi:MAG: hypothetical protein U0992_20630 [Planctomycetaceae bacterium]
MHFDYKFNSAVLEDYYHVSPEFRDRYLAAGIFNLRVWRQDSSLVAHKGSAASKAVSRQLSAVSQQAYQARRMLAARSQRRTADKRRPASLRVLRDLL